MSEKRYFYTDPLAAAWMAKHFGMRFTSEQGIELEWCGEFNCFHLPDDAELSQACDGKHYIHSDSLLLLEPQVADMYLIEDSLVVLPMDVNLCKKWDKRPEGKLIQRNGICFHWPESEAA